MRVTIDRIEGGRAVLEFAPGPGEEGRVETLDIPLAALPSGAKEGQSVLLALGPAGPDATLAEAEARLARLKSKTSQGPGSFDL